jgi:protein-S-isoprenylcysteine O-methyltransferase Ste14
MLFPDVASANMKGKVGPALGSLLFFVVAPGTVAGLVPYLLSGWRLEPPFFGVSAVRMVGGVLIVLGVVALVECFARFAFQGRGTPAPVAPTETLVVSGLYRYVRNPMYIAVVSIIVGQAMLLGSSSLLGYAAIVWLMFHLFVLAYEEPTMRRSHGDSYAAYRANVRRWLPRIRPWEGTTSSVN